MRILRVLRALGVAAGIGSGVASPIPADEGRDQPSDLPVTGAAVPQMAPLDELLTGFVRERNIPGAALAVSRGGRLIYSRGFGYADREAQTAVEPDALFRIASISKPITAVAVMQLVERGRLGLDDRMTDLVRLAPFLPPGSQVDPRLAQVTVRQLLHHTAGWDRDHSFMDPMFHSVEIARLLSAAPPARPEQIIRYMFGRPLDFDPGARYAYSNIGYCVLGRIIESVCGQSYEDYVREHVLLPLGITRMRIGRTLPGGRAEGEVRYYVAGETKGAAVVGPQIGQPVPWPYGGWSLEAMDAHGGWIASAPDLVRFALAFDDPDNCPLLKPETIATMFARPEGLAGHDEQAQPRDAYYACGWFVRPIGSAGRANHWHTGSLDGTSTLLVRRHDGLNWAVLFNTRNAPRDEVPARLIDPLLHRAVDECWGE